jgi:hypothetical protein
VKYPDNVEILRPYGPDEYGNPGASWLAPTSAPAVAFLISKTSAATGETATTALMPVDADVRSGDRMRLDDGRVFDVTVDEIRSPSRSILKSVTLTRTAEGA